MISSIAETRRLHGRQDPVDPAPRLPDWPAVAQMRLMPTGPMVVYPRWHSLAADWVSGQKNAGYMVSSAVPTRNTASDYLGVRDYRPGRQPQVDPLAQLGAHRQPGGNRILAPVSHNAVFCCWIRFRELIAARNRLPHLRPRSRSPPRWRSGKSGHNRRFGIGSSPGDAETQGARHSQIEEAMYWLAQVEATTAQPHGSVRRQACPGRKSHRSCS